MRQALDYRVKGYARVTCCQVYARSLERNMAFCICDEGAAKRTKGFVEFRNEYGTADNIANGVRCGALEADTAGLAVELYLSPSPIAKLGGVTDPYLVRPVESSYSLDCVSNESCFSLKLRRVSEVLKLTPAAIAKVPARRI